MLLYLLGLPISSSTGSSLCQLIKNKNFSQTCDPTSHPPAPLFSSLFLPKSNISKRKAYTHCNHIFRTLWKML